MKTHQLTISEPSNEGWDAMTLELYSQTSFSKMFMLTLLLIMSTTLLSCKKNNKEDMLRSNVAYADSLTVNHTKFDTVYYSDVKDIFENKQELPKVIATDTLYINPGDDMNLKYVVMIRPGDSILAPPPPPVKAHNFKVKSEDLRIEKQPNSN